MIKKETAFAVAKFLSVVTAGNFIPTRTCDSSKIEEKRRKIAMLEAQNRVRLASKRG